jgi:excisionase family DNA binding protein
MGVSDQNDQHRGTPGLPAPSIRASSSLGAAGTLIRNESTRQIELASAILPEILTAAEVAHELRCSKAHVHNLINGRVHGALPLPTIRLGRRRLVRRASLDEWLRANERTLG